MYAGLGDAIVTGTPELHSELEARRYRITAVLGKGGFGKVYRAILEGPGGFHKDVAIKLLKDQEVPALTLSRFRDEARILGLVRDRAIVNVDPPTRLAGRWAVVMEYVDGASIQRLMSLGPMPATVAAEIVQEVARVLDKVYRMPGPDGEPLRILHRDIKPANIQVTPDGEVKVLDFGIAKADFEARETHTNAYIGGTRGYIAPERLEGIDAPAGDVYSLGVTLHFMVSGERLTKRQAMGLDDPDTQQVDGATKEMIALASRMRAANPSDRPTAREVEETCAKIRRRFDGVSLRTWAETTVARAAALKFADEMVGSVLSETLASVVPSEERLAEGHEFVLRPSGHVRRTPRRGPVLLALAALAAIVSVAVALMVFTFAGTLWVLSTVYADELARRAEPAPLPVLTLSGPRDPAHPVPTVAPATPTVPDPVPDPVPASVSVTSPAPDAGGARPQPDPQPPAPTAAPARPVEPRPTPAPATEGAPDAATDLPITFSSVPLGADVFVDGRPMGQTPILELALAAGAHEVRMEADGQSLVRTITVGRRNPVRYVWKGGDTWELYY